MRLAFAAAVLVALSTAALAKGKPDWVSGSSMQYPREQYLIGVGEGDDTATSEDRARGEISKIFSAQVTVNTNVSESETSQGSGKSSTNQFQQSISNNVQTVSKKALEGVEIVDHWEDEASRERYALAVLDRAKALAAASDKLADFDKEIVSWKDQMDKAAEKLPRVRAALKVLALLSAREDLAGELRVLDASGKGSPSPVDAAVVKPAAAKAISELDVVVAMSGEASSQIKTGIVQGLTGFGLQAKTGADAAAGPADILVEGAVKTNQMQGDADKRWQWARSTVTVSLKDAKTAKVFTQFDASDREASGDYQEAVRRSRKQLADKVAKQINEAITSYFENQ